MHNLTKIFLTSLALTLGACDAEPGGDLGDGAIEFRSGFGTFKLNTGFIETLDFGEMELNGLLHEGARLKSVCMTGKRGVCIYPAKDELFVKKSEIMAQKGDVTYMGADFVGSRWFLEVDYDSDGALDSTIEMVVLDVKANATAAGVAYWDYFWAYDTKTVTGLATKYIKPEEKPVPLCEVDVETGSVGSVALEHTSIDTTPATKGLVEEVQDVLFVACHSGAAGKAPSWGYVLHEMGHERYTNVLRVMRADYCHSGEPFTKAGQKVAVTDALGINNQYDPAHALEGLASFKEGWLCINTPRLVDLHEVTSTCDIKICDETGILGDYDSDIMTQVEMP